MNLTELSAGPPLDVAIIGGGINGCGIAHELTLRGLRVGLFEKDDFGFGTTWRSTKLVHGGLRYLEHGEVGLVFESLRERAWLLKTRPHLVRPQRFLLPMLPWTRRPRWQLRIGLTAYDALALRRSVPPHRGLSRSAMARLMPPLTGEANGGFSFYDARLRAPERLALELALEARDGGAAVFNHAPVRRIDTEAGRVRSLQVQHGGACYTVPANAVINAAGPWVDAVVRLTGAEQTPLLDVTRGTHIVVETADPLGRDAIFTTAKSDGRVFFVVPEGNLLQIGTTDERYDGAPGDIRPTSRDIDYLLAEAQLLLPGLDLSLADVRYSYAGLRPLQRVAGGPEAAVSRRHALIDHARSGGPEGLFSVVGGKLSTFRPLAAEVAKRLGAAGGASSEASPSRWWQDELKASPLSPLTKRRLARYGPAATTAIVELGTGAIEAAGGAVEGEVRHAIRNELASTLSDIMMRRTGISWSEDRGIGSAGEVAAIAAEELRWDRAERTAQEAAFHADLRKHLPTPVELDGNWPDAT